MNSNDVYHSLTIDLVSNCGMNMFDARKVVKYDALKEYYLEDQDDEE